MTIGNIFIYILKNFSKDEWTNTKSGYNPLKEDFMNTSFFLTEI